VEQYEPALNLQAQSVPTDDRLSSKARARTDLHHDDANIFPIGELAEIDPVSAAAKTSGCNVAEHFWSRALCDGPVRYLA
jgi:hypothetical protein